MVDELVPCLAAVIDEIVIRFEDAVGEPVVAHELPDIFHWVEFGAFRRQGDNGDVGRHDEARRHVPTGLIGEEYGVGSWCDHLGDFREMQVHRLGVASRQDQRRALAILWADGAEDIGRGGALIAGSARARAALGPPARDLIFLADARLVGEPDLYRARIDAFLARDFVQAPREFFLKFSIAPLAWA